VRRFAFVFLVVLLASGSIPAQKRGKPVAKKPVIRATVTVKGDGAYKPIVLPSENDSGVWNSVELTEHKVKIDFPSKGEEVLEDAEVFDIDIGKVWSYSAETKHATYRLMVRDVPEILDNRDIENVLDSTISSVLGNRKAFKSKSTVYYGGYVGREILIEEEMVVQAARLYILNKKLFAIFVTAEPKAHWPSIEPWVRRFFDSFSVDLPTKNHT
jgi:hypothetical protein